MVPCRWEYKLLEAEQPPVKQTFSPQDSSLRREVCPEHSTSSPMPNRLACMSPYLAAAWTGKNSFFYLTSPQIQCCLFSTSTNINKLQGDTGWKGKESGSAQRVRWKQGKQMDRSSLGNWSWGSAVQQKQQVSTVGICTEVLPLGFRLLHST